ncbi:MAG TPA: TfoX/Sxy family protein [Candidatus Rubneribacter avistercoris]|nr:TfoX/Sxy family protein [Candidatus Rubneribacter avistercoris]
MANLADLPNIGSHLAECLMEADVEAPEDLVALGAERAWLKVQAVDPGACLHMLYALEGTVRGIHKKELDPARKQQLKEFANANRPADA